MIDGLRAIYEGLNSLRIQGYTYIWANMAFVVLSLPLVTAPAALSALFRVSYIARTEAHEADLALFWECFRANIFKTLPWGVLHAGFVIVNFMNLIVYQDTPGIFQGFRLVWIGSGVIWFAVFLYTWPIYYEMQEPSLIGATRNALIMILQNPLFTLTILAGVLLLAVVSTVFIAAWVVLTWGAISAIATAAVLNRISIYRESRIN